MKNNPIPVQEFLLSGGGRLFVAPTNAHDVVSIEGSVFGGPNMLASELDVIPGLASELLDAGTAKKSKDVLRDSLAQRGATLAFSSHGDRTAFSGRCFPEEVPVLLSTIAECIDGAIFPEKEVKNVKALVLGALSDSKSDTRTRAEIVFSELLYNPGHVNYMRSIQAEEKSVTRVRRRDLQNFRTRLGTGGLVLAIAGDIDANAVEGATKKAFSWLGQGTLTASAKKANDKAPSASEELVPLNDKANVDVFLGASVPVTYTHELYHPMRVVAEMLGGGFASHLMQTVRERDGLTYGVYSRLVGITDGADGYFKIWATFSPNKYKESVATLRKEVRTFFAKGMTETMLARKKEEIVGSYLVSLSTTQSLASTLHTIGAYGFDLSYLAEYPNIISAVTLHDIRNAASMIPLSKLSLAASGTFQKK